MADILTEAREFRSIVEKAVVSGLDDTDALSYPTLFPIWDPNSKTYYGPNDGNGPQSKVRYEETLYRCISSHQSQITWAPPISPSLWVRMDDPAEEWPIWIQPVGSTDAYAANAKVTHNGKRWENTHGDGNVWEPGVYGWMEVA